MTTENSTTQERDVVDVLTADHQAMLDLLDETKQATNAEHRRDTADTVIAEIVRHSVAEEMQVYPAMRQHLPNGAEEVEHDIEEHNELDEVMKRLEDVPADDGRFMQILEELEAHLRHHISDEEDEQFLKLREHIPAAQLREMGEKVEQAKRTAPTRPHPNAPNSELYHKTVGAGVGMVDRLRDKLANRKT
ncbi:hemerythrin domain-containing protein [Yaniella halotolerans]|uniref:hemerythrin domain-containing protein n=1 Tax=Yaniella halotolerans TaxID=225453 RepID=UPI0003B461CB|nr:hemerythrin domain-containing protein [Yaniella halotolerans]